MEQEIRHLLRDNERQQTDRSLADERSRIDESFKSQSQLLENETNLVVENLRSKADQNRSERRAGKDQKTNDANVLSERYAEDKAIENERRESDLAFDHERIIKQSDLHRFMGKAREITNSDIFKERAQTDRDSTQRMDLLTAEQVAHSSTKTQLTTREEFLAIVSHDLRNPIGAISSCTDMLLNDSTFGLSEEVRHWIEFLKRNADTSLRLISDILDMERISEGKIGLQLARHQLSDIMKEVVENYAQVALSRSISLRTFPKATELITCDRDRISQVLSNLIGNAIKFTPEGGKVTVDLHVLEREVRVSVCDSGPGIVEDQKTRIFERFAQIHNKDRRGLGLGLYISKMFIELHHGKLEVTSEVGKGSTFYFTLPL